MIGLPFSLKWLFCTNLSDMKAIFLNSKKHFVLYIYFCIFSIPGMFIYTVYIISFPGMFIYTGNDYFFSRSVYIYRYYFSLFQVCLIYIQVIFFFFPGMFIYTGIIFLFSRYVYIYRYYFSCWYLYVMASCGHSSLSHYSTAPHQ